MPKKRPPDTTDTVLGILSFVGLLIAAVPSVNQAWVWLATGVAPQRDIFWLLSPSKCAQTGLNDLGWTGKDLCRVEMYHFTDMAGLDKLLHWAFDQHVAAIAIPTSLVVCLVATTVLKMAPSRPAPPPTFWPK